MGNKRGFTLIELMIVLAVTAVLIMLVAPSFRDFIMTQRLKGVNAQIVTDMQFARAESASRNLSMHVRFGQNDTKSCYVLYTGDDHACDCLQSPVCPAVNGIVEVRTVAVERSLGVLVAKPATQADEFKYDPSTGGIEFPASEFRGVDNSKFMVLASVDTGRTLRTEVGLAGRPSVCAPTGSTMSVDPCPP